MTLVAIGCAVLIVALLLVGLALLRRLEVAVDRVEQGRADLVGVHCVVNTRRPDDLSIRGVVREQYADGGILLGGAAILAGDGGETPCGDYYIAGAAISGVQVNAPVPTPRER